LRNFLQFCSALGLTFGLTAGIACSSSSGSQGAGGVVPVTPLKPTADEAACQKMNLPSGQILNYCVKASDSTTPTSDVIYFFHGLYGSAEEIKSSYWKQAFAMVKQQMGGRAPHVVSLSFGPTALITPVGANTSFPSTQELLQNALPAIESRLPWAGKPARRFLLGMSLGGFNAMTVATADPSRFSALALLCPAIVDLDPFDAQAVSAYKQRNAAILNLNWVNTALMLIQNSLGSSQNWQLTSPMVKLRAGVLDQIPTFLSTGQSDQYGFFEGAQHFVDVAQSHRMPLVWAPVQGGHCSFDQMAFAQFMIEHLQN
jgi:pimeloyl-ACP methyl ester carboxylesterase